MNDHIYLKIKKLHDDAWIPERATAYSAGLDLHAYTKDIIIIKSGLPYATEIPTGIAVEIPTGYEGQIRIRSSVWKNGLDILPGTIDSDYRGQIIIQARLPMNSTQEFNYLEDSEYKIYNGDRIAQLVISPIPSISVVEVEQLNNTSRGTGGFGSTGR